MIQEHAHDPASGAPLAETKDYPPGVRRGRDQGAREVVEHPLAVTGDWVANREGSLTNGELVSSTDGLFGYFRRVHRQVRAPKPPLDAAAKCAIKQVKRTEQDGEVYYDATVWYVVAERLARKGYWVAWMLDHANARCVHPTASGGRCGSSLKFRPGVDGLEGVCASAPNRHGAVDDAIRDRIRELYRVAFDVDSNDRPIDLVLF